jgi:hypothetical protein
MQVIRFGWYEIKTNVNFQDNNGKVHIRLNQYQTEEISALFNET